MTMRPAAMAVLALALAATVRAQAPSPRAASPAQGAPKPAPAAQPPAKPAPAPAASAGQPPPQTPSSAGQGGSRTDQLIEPPGFAYNPEGRRDPFVSLARRGADSRGGAEVKRPAGLAGLSVAEVTLRGTVRSREGFVAILQGADQRAYIVRPGDKLFDGTVRAVSQNDVVILQQVNDPLSLDKQREVRKVLRQTEAN